MALSVSAHRLRRAAPAERSTHSSPFSCGTKSMPDVPGLGDQLAAVDADVVPVGPELALGLGTALGDRPAVCVGARPGEPGPSGADMLEHMGVGVADGGELHHLVEGSPVRA